MHVIKHSLDVLLRKQFLRTHQIKYSLNNLENKKEAKTFDLESLLSPFLLNHHYDLL